MRKHKFGPYRVENWDALTLAWLKSPEGAADARLIKASPDLLEACRKAMTCASIPDSVREVIQAALARAAAPADGRGNG